MNHHKMK